MYLQNFECGTGMVNEFKIKVLNFFGGTYLEN